MSASSADLVAEVTSATGLSGKVAVIIPCFCVAETIVEVVREASRYANTIYCVDDGCPEGSGKCVADAFPAASHVRVLQRSENGGVGAATTQGYRAAIEDGAEILVKIDGDGQMDPRLIPDLVRPITEGEADYVKANRFFSVETIAQMPTSRVLGNAGLSFLTKLSSGYWDLFDPTNGFTALHARVAAEIPWDRIHARYFFESDVLFRLGVLRARVIELPLLARYGDEASNLSELRALVTFPLLHARNFVKRVAYNYFLRNFSLASVNLVMGLLLFGFGVCFGAWRWFATVESGFSSTAGTVMLAALPVILGIQFLLSFIAHDISMTPSQPLHPRLSRVMVLGSDRRHA